MDAFLQTFLQQFQNLKIPLEEIISATNNFDDQNKIGGGGFGKVYKGEVSHSGERSMVAIKRLDRRHGQGRPEFLKEITMLSRYKHENLISLLGFCCEGDEMILVYEHASRGSLDHHLISPHVTWKRRLKICIDAAKGLRYLHDPRETHQRLIHCDIKSSNILLDDQWNAKVSDFGLSIMGPANEQHSLIVTFAAGTPGYCDPQYALTNTLTKESDVYSFGVVLFEVLCGTLCCTYSNGSVEQILVSRWIESYKQKQLNDIIFKNPAIRPIDQCSLEIVSDIAYRCLKEYRENRPKMTEVVTELETALETLEFCEWELRFDYEEMAKSAEPPLNYRTKVELRRLLSKGVLLNGGKTWFWLNKKGEHCELMSFAECVVTGPPQFEYYSWSGFHSRFAVRPYHFGKRRIKTRVKTQFLLPGITYKVNLLFKFAYRMKTTKPHEYICLDYKLQGENPISISYLACEGEDGWWMCELFQFTSDRRNIELEILFCNVCYLDDDIGVEGIEFSPLEKVEHKDEKQPILYSDANLEENLPTNYEDIMKLSKNSMQWTTKKEAYSIMCKGFLINDGQEWFSLDKNGKQCLMMSVRAADIRGSGRLSSLADSRFGEAVRYDVGFILFRSKLQPQLLLSQTTYASYLVYKLAEHQSNYEAPVKVMDEVNLGSGDNIYYIYLVSPQTPVIRPTADQNTHNPLNWPKMKGVPRQRNDGWMEVQIWEFQTPTIPEMRLHLELHDGNWLYGLIIQGVEFRPI